MTIFSLLISGEASGYRASLAMQVSPYSLVVRFLAHYLGYNFCASRLGNSLEGSRQSLTLQSVSVYATVSEVGAGTSCFWIYF